MSHNASIENRLVNAAGDGNVAEVQALLAAGADVDARATFGAMALTHAALLGHYRVAQILLEAGANIDATNRDGETALDLATRRGHIDIVRVLLNAGADVNKKTNRGETPLIRALRFWGAEILRILVRARGVDVDLQSSAWINNYSVKNTPVWWAARTGNVVGLQMLINAGAILTSRGGDSDLTPLQVAISEGNDACANIITEAIAQEKDQAIINRHDSSTEGSVSSIPEEE